MRTELYVIESRNSDGSIIADGEQPHSFFGLGAIHGMNTNQMAKLIFRRMPDACLDGGHIATWPKLINPNWIARKKTW